MNEKIRITGIGGSLDDFSHSLSALRYVLSELSASGAETSLVDIKELNLPPYDYSGGTKPPAPEIKKLMDLLHSSNGLVFSSPEYHGTVSAVFKNVIDYMEYLSAYQPPYLTLKPIGCISIGGGYNSGVLTLNTMINIVHSLRGITVSSNIAISNAKQVFNSEGKILDDNIKRRLKRLAGDIFLTASKLSN